MRRRVLTAALAVLLAVLGTVGVLAYVRQADTRAVAGMKAVSVLVARQRIPSGTSAGAALSSGLLASQTLPASSVPADALRDLSGVGGLVTDADIQPGQLLLRPMLVTSAQVTGGLALPAGMVAVTLQLCLPEAVAGNLHAGSVVAVYGTQAAAAGSGGALTAQPNCTGPHQQQGAGTAHTKLVLPQVQILSVGAAGAAGQSGTASGALATGSSGPSGGQGTTLVTVAVSQANAPRLILLAETGLPYLALLK